MIKFTDSERALGEVAYSLRSALDHIAYVFCQPQTSREEREVQFPIVSRKENWRSEADRKLPGASRKVRAAIERLQPYHRRKNKTLICMEALRAISNWDKHRAFLVATMLPSGIRGSFNPRPMTKIINLKFYPRPIKVGAILARFEVTHPAPGLQVNLTQQLASGSFFDRRMPKEIRGEPVMPTLALTCMFITMTVLPAFEAILLSGAPG